MLLLLLFDVRMHHYSSEKCTVIQGRFHEYIAISMLRVFKGTKIYQIDHLLMDELSEIRRLFFEIPNNMMQAAFEFDGKLLLQLLNLGRKISLEHGFRVIRNITKANTLNRCLFHIP
jgi:hypothetical protein